MEKRVSKELAEATVDSSKSLIMIAIGMVIASTIHDALNPPTKPSGLHNNKQLPKSAPEHPEEELQEREPKKRPPKVGGLYV